MLAGLAAARDRGPPGDPARRPRPHPGQLRHRRRRTTASCRPVGICSTNRACARATTLWSSVIARAGHIRARPRSRPRRRRRAWHLHRVSGDLARRPARRPVAAPRQSSAGRRPCGCAAARTPSRIERPEKYDFSGLEKGEGKMIIGMQEGAKRDGVRDQRIAKVVELAPPGNGCSRSCRWAGARQSGHPRPRGSRRRPARHATRG